MIDAGALLRAVIAVAACYAVAYAAAELTAFSAVGWWGALAVAVLAFYVVLSPSRPK